LRLPPLVCVWLQGDVPKGVPMTLTLFVPSPYWCPILGLAVFAATLEAVAELLDRDRNRCVKPPIRSVIGLSERALDRPLSR